MIIESLYPEDCSYFGDNGNLLLLKTSLPQAECYSDYFGSEPYFVKHTPDFLLMGGMSERVQERVICELLPYRQRLRELIEQDVVILFTSNACEVLFQYIEKENGEHIPALNLYPLWAKRNMMKRFNCHFIGHDDQGEIIMGYKSQFTLAHGENPHPWLQVERGAGSNLNAATEGIHEHQLYATYLLGPLLTMNPPFTQKLLQSKNPQAKCAFMAEGMAAYQRHLAEFKNPATAFFEKD